MKKKTLIILFLITVLLTGCEETSVEVTPTVNTVQMEYSDFDLIMDQKTGVVYIDNVIITFDNGLAQFNHVYTPYFGKYGNPCKFVDGILVDF